MRDLCHNILTVSLLDPVNITADQVSTGADRQGFEGLDLTAFIGLSADTLSGSVFIELKLEESDTLGSGYTAVTDQNHVLLPAGETIAALGLFATINDPAEDNISKTIGYRGRKRFARINIDLTGTHTNGTPVAVSATKAFPHNAATQ